MGKFVIKSHRDIVEYCREQNIPISEFNEPVDIDPAVTDCGAMFKNCTSFNQKVVIPDRVKNCSGMFFRCKSFNQSILIPGSVTNCSFMFSACISLNKPIAILDGDDRRTAANMFHGCESFNQLVVIPRGFEILDEMFRNCTSFNQDVKIPSSVRSARRMFKDCVSFNQPLTITFDGLRKSTFATDDYYIFEYDEILEVCDNIFEGCTSFMQTLAISLPNRDLRARYGITKGLLEIR